ncbi:MAG: T9SS type A sorting domain-containing protein [Bacteroidetes bacterium]|nr:T9SS type A sorting domain-containing protein [Bacteroidota bacterium]
MKKILLIIMGVILTTSIFSQTLSPTVVASSGGYFVSGSSTLSFTVAEMTMIQTFSSHSNILTQGFQQPYDLAVSITEPQYNSEGISVYPNPTTGYFTLSYSNNDNSTSNIKLYNLVGQVVLNKQVSSMDGFNKVNFDISKFRQGIYMIELTKTSAGGEKKTEFRKINLVY